MAIITNIANLSQTAANNGPDGAVDPPSTLDDQIRYLGAFIAQLRDQVGFTAQIIAPGVMSMYGGGTAPAGWLLCNGAAVSRTTYAALFTAISTSWGVGDGSTTFNVPNMQGAFPRGLDNGRGLDPGRVLGTYQDTNFQAHSHGINDAGHIHGVGDPGHLHGGATGGGGTHNHYVNDPGHNHQYGFVGGAGVNYNGAGGNPAPHARDVGVSGTGIWLSDNGDHAHAITTDSRGTGIWIGNSGTGISIQAAGIAETRPRNYACNFIIKV